MGEHEVEDDVRRRLGSRVAVSADGPRIFLYAGSENGRYSLRPRVLELGYAYLSSISVDRLVHRQLLQLADQLHESCSAGVLDGHEVVYVDRLESAHSLRLFTETGRRVPVHCTSSGKVLLAHLPEARRHAMLRAISLTALTPHTITDRDRFAAELARVRRRGWAEAVNEREIGIASIAAPIRGAGGEVVAAISIGVPLARCSVMALRRLAPTIMEAAEAASRRLGWSPELASPEPASSELASSELASPELAQRREG